MTDRKRLVYKKALTERYPSTLLVILPIVVLGGILEYIVTSSFWLFFGVFTAIVLCFLYFYLYKVASEFWTLRSKSLASDDTPLTVGVLTKMLDSSVGRENSTILMGTILIPTAFGLLGAAALPTATCSQRQLLAVLSPGLYVIWLFTVQLSTRLMDDLDFRFQLSTTRPKTDKQKPSDQRQAVEILEKFYGEKHGNGIMMQFRRNLWLLYLPLLTLGASFLINHGLSPFCI